MLNATRAPSPDHSGHAALSATPAVVGIGGLISIGAEPSTALVTSAGAPVAVLVAATANRAPSGDHAGSRRPLYPAIDTADGTIGSPSPTNTPDLSNQARRPSRDQVGPPPPQVAKSV